MIKIKKEKFTRKKNVKIYVMTVRNLSSSTPISISESLDMISGKILYRAFPFLDNSLKNNFAKPEKTKENNEILNINQ